MKLYMNKFYIYMHYYEEPNKYVYKIYIQTLCIIYDHYQIFIIII